MGKAVVLMVSVRGKRAKGARRGHLAIAGSCWVTLCEQVGLL